MSAIPTWLDLARVVAHYTCRTAGCRRRGQDVLPSLRSCPACGKRLARRDMP
jgi:rRNA maturation endonuclease Nob1